MRTLRFDLKGETAFFKKPDVNVHAYFTYSHIHKVALFGLLGAIMGLGGYMQQYDNNYPLSANRKKVENLIRFPQFFEVLGRARVSIVPHGDRGYFSKKIQIFNNTVGYASQEEGNVLNIREQWLEKPHWTIYVADDEGLPPYVFATLTDYMLHSQSIYMPYLGKNDHPATLCEPAIIEVKETVELQFIDSLYPAGQIEADPRGMPKRGQRLSFFKEIMPIGLNETSNGYIYKPLVYTNQEIAENSITEFERRQLYRDENRTIYFI